MANFCKSCGSELEGPLEAYDAFEGMHWLCFHYAFEHYSNDPDVPCQNRHCPTWHIEILKEALIARGEDPDKIINDAIELSWSKSLKTKQSNGVSSFVQKGLSKVFK
jgi:hypothetical protein